MATLTILTGALLSATWIILGWMLVSGSRRILLLSQLLEREGLGPGAATPPSLPRLSVVIAARNEAAAIETTVRSLLRQTLPGLELVVVDDRSTDGTTEILDRLAAESPGRLSVIHHRQLPRRWLGKCHACHTGAERAKGEFLLFLDGDVAFLEDDLLARVVALVARLHLDHLALFPDLRPITALQAGLVSVFDQAMLLATRAHEMDRDRPRGGGGVGAFNLVRRTAYDRVGGHLLLRMEVADDMKLGILLKESGARQRIMSGLGLVRCPWHRGALGVMRGLEKNFFAGLDYSLPLLVLSTLLVLALQWGPAIVALAGRGPWRWAPWALQAAAILAGFTASRHRFAYSPLPLLLMYPVSLILLMAALWNSALTTIWQRGVRWRDTFYPLSELRSGVVPRGAGRRYLVRLSDGPAGGRRPAP